MLFINSFGDFVRVTVEMAPDLVYFMDHLPEEDTCSLDIENIFYEIQKHNRIQEYKNGKTGINE